LVGPLRFLYYAAVILIGGGALALAFAKYGDQNAEVFLLSAINTFIHPRKRVWKKEEHKEENIKPVEKKEEAPEEKRTDIKDARSGLEQLAEIVDSGGYSTLSDGRRGSTGESSEKVTNTEEIIDKEKLNEDKVETMMIQAEKNTPKRDQLVSEVASIKPSESQEETPTIKLRKDQYYKIIK